MASSLGLEPKTVRLEGGSSIQLSYDDRQIIIYQRSIMISSFLISLSFGSDGISVNRDNHIARLGTITIAPDGTGV